MIASRETQSLGIFVLLLLPACFGYQGATTVATAPVFVWGSREHVVSVPGLDATKVSYQTLPVSNVVDAVLKSVAVGAPEPRPEVLLVMLGSQLELNALPKGSVLEPLKAMLRSAAASIMLPFAQRRTNDGALYAPVASQLESHPSLQLVELCAQSNEDIPTAVADAAKAADAGKPVVLLMCSPQAGGLASELAALQAASDTLAASGRQYVVLYTADSAGKASSARGRSLQEGWGEQEDSSSSGYNQDTECDDKCRAQVRALEAFILLFILLLAVAGGTFMMGAVDTPTRFETPKKEHGPMD